METEPADDYIRKSAAFIRANEQALAGGIIRRGRRSVSAPTPSSMFNVWGWIGMDGNNAPKKPMVMSIDLHHLFYLLMRFEALGIDVGSLDVRHENPSRPLSYISMLTAKDKSDSMSISSFRSSLSVVSKLSLGGGWWSKPETASIDNELKYMYSAFTKLPALSIHQPGLKIIAELANDPPNDSAVPLDAFKNLQSLECLDIDPRTILGWDRLAEGLRSLTIKRSGIEDVSEILIGAVLDDQARREGNSNRPRQRNLLNQPGLRSRQPSWHASQLPPSVPEDDEDSTPDPSPPPSPPLPTLSGLKWAFIKHLSFADNALTFFPTAPLSYLTSLTHLDLSSNLLVSVPPGLSQLYNLVSLNLSDNMIDSVLGIYTRLGQLLTLNLARNRLESLCGLERLAALERVDLRHNRVEESGEVGRLAPLPNVAEVWVEGNPFVRTEEDYRVKCFDYFAKEGKSIILDGTPPSYYERRNLTAPAPEPRPTPSTTAPSPPVVAVGGYNNPPTVVSSPPLAPTADSEPTGTQAQPQVLPPTKSRRRKNKRIVDLDGGDIESGEDVGRHSRSASESGPKPRDPSPVKKPTEAPKDETKPVPVSAPKPRPFKAPPATLNRHSRRPTDFAFGSPEREPPMPVRHPSGSATITAASSKRRARVSASVYEPGTPTLPGANVVAGSPPNDAAAFRAKIEALRSEVGDSWLKVLSQSQFTGGDRGVSVSPPKPITRQGEVGI